MCKVGDIIIIRKYKDNGKTLNRHSFVVIDDENGEIQGYDFDMACNVMSSFKDDEQRARKLSYEGNFPVTSNDKTTNPDNGKDGYIKAEQIYYFKKDKIEFQVIGSMNEDTLKELFEFIEKLEKFQLIIDNIKN